MSLYRGLLPPILVETPKRAIKFSANDYYGKVYSRLLTTDGKLTQKWAAHNRAASDAHVMPACN